jgi:hypothetical protein
MKLKPGVGLDGASLARHPLVAASLQGLQSKDTFDASVEAICELIFSTVDSQGPLRGMDPLIQRLVPAVRGRFRLGPCNVNWGLSEEVLSFINSNLC